MALEGIEAHPDDIVRHRRLASRRVDLVTRVFCDPGDVVLCEAPSYVGALGVFGAYECDVVHVEMDDDGLVPDGARARDRGDRGGRAARSSSSTRSRTSTTPPASLCRQGDVSRSWRSAAATTCWCWRTTPTACWASTPSRCGRCGPTSPSGWSTSARSPRPSRPGFRVGWALAPHAVREKLVLAQESATLCPPAFSPAGRLGVPRARTTGRARSRSSARCTASGETRCSTRSTT